MRLNLRSVCDILEEKEVGMDFQNNITVVTDTAIGIGNPNDIVNTVIYHDDFGWRKDPKKRTEANKEECAVGISFRHSSGFGKRIEYKLIGDMLMEGLDCYVPLVDDHGVDCVVKKSDGTFIEIQIKARSKTVKDGDAALFSAIDHQLTENFYFVFYSERLDMMWILSSEEFIKECVTNKSGKNTGRRSIWFNGNKTNRTTGEREEYCKQKYEKYICTDFSCFK